MMITLQLSSATDYITKDGTELTKKPYPFHADEKGNLLDGRDEVEIIGFQADAARQQVDVRWEDYADPYQAVGMYVVTKDKAGQYSTHLHAVESVEVTP